MKKINVSVTKAQILSYRVEITKDAPQVSATIGLFTDGGKKISEYSISTNSWNDEDKFEIEPTMLSPIMDIMYDLEGIVVRHMNEGQLTLKKGDE